METQNRVYVSLMAYDLVGSEILRIAAEVNRLKALGKEIINFTVGDFNPKDFQLPAELTERIILNYREGQTNYPPAMGTPELRNAIANLYKDMLGVHYDANEILVGAGCRPLIYTFFATIIDPGDKVVFGVPSWNTNHYCHLVGAMPIEVQTSARNRFLPMAEDLAEQLVDATVLALCSPSNPSGTMYERDELADICAIVLRINEQRTLRGAKPLYILYDQIYWKLSAKGREHYHPVLIEPKLKDFVVYVDGISKSLAATGIRVGWMLGSKPVIEKMSSILGHIGAWAPKPEQLGLAAYLPMQDVSEQFNIQLKSKIFGRLEALYQGFREMALSGLPINALEPQGAIYLTVEVAIIGRKTEDGVILTKADDILSYLMHEAGVAIVPFYAFGIRSDHWFRISVGGISDSDVEKSLKNIRQALLKLQPRY